jgi:VCBS repeat-containing protein
MEDQMRKGTNVHRQRKSLQSLRAACAGLERLESRTLMTVAGPDTFGYFADTHTYETIDLAAGGAGVGSLAELALDDDDAQELGLGGDTFNFYGIEYDTVNVSNNGLLTFEALNRASEDSPLVPLFVAPPAIAPAFDNWITYNGDFSQVLYRFDDLNGDGTNDRLVVEWSDVQRQFGLDGTVTFQAMLELNTGSRPGAITFNYVDMTTGDDFTNGKFATVGIKSGGEDAAHRLIVQHATDGSGFIADGTAVQIFANQAPTAVNDSFSLDEDWVISANVLWTDSDPDRDSMTAILVDGPTNGAVELDADGWFLYTPRQDFFGTDTFTYRVVDSRGATSGVATVTFTVREVNDAPVANADAAVTNEDAGVTGNVLGNDADADNTDGISGNEDALSAALVIGPQHGTAVLSADGSFHYTPAENYFGADSFVYCVTDSRGRSSRGTVTINVAAVNDAPVAMNDLATATHEAALVGNVRVNDTDVDNDTADLVTSVVTATQFGTLTLDADGQFTYVPNPGFAGEDSFVYAVTDPSGLSSNGTVTITVTAEPEPEEGSVQVIADVTRPGHMALLVNGTANGDLIVIAPACEDGSVEVYFGCESLGVFEVSGRVIVHGMGGGDLVYVTKGVENVSWLYGDEGNDLLMLGDGGGIAFGGAGNDALIGGKGRDVLVGGQGSDVLLGSSGEDLLIAALTVFDDRFSNASHEDAWAHLHGEWASPRGFTERVNNLRDGSGGGERLNGSYYLNDSTVEDDLATDSVDLLSGSGGNDWFLYKFSEDLVLGMNYTERQVDLGIS